MDKRTFLKNTSLLGLGSLVSFAALGKMADAVAHLSPADLAEDEGFWASLI